MISSEQVQRAEEQIGRKYAELNYDTRQLTVEYLANNFFPDTSRGKIYSGINLIWDKNQQSKFIESMLIGLPVPAIFMLESIQNEGENEGENEREDENCQQVIEIIDGTQRLRTIVSYVRSEFSLRNLTNLTLLNNFYFRDLSLSRQRKFANIGLRAVMVQRNTPEYFKYEIIDRYNSMVSVGKSKVKDCGSITVRP